MVSETDQPLKGLQNRYNTLSYFSLLSFYQKKCRDYEARFKDRKFEIAYLNRMHING